MPDSPTPTTAAMRTVLDEVKNPRSLAAGVLGSLLAAGWGLGIIDITPSKCSDCQVQLAVEMTRNAYLREATEACRTALEKKP